MMQFESLENRVLAAGNVTLKITSGQLHITGDSNDNALSIAEPDGLDTIFSSTVVIRGLNGTTIDNQSTANLTIYVGSSKDFSSIRVAMRGGNDSVSASDNLSGLALSIDLGTGDDRLSAFEPRTFFNAVDVFGGDGDDRIALTGDFGGRVRIFPGGGRDHVSLGGLAHRGFEIDDSGSGGFVALTDITAKRPSRIALTDAIDRLSIVNGRFFQRLQVFAKGGTDEITVHDFVANTLSTIDSGDGDDRFDLSGERINLSVVQ